MADYLNDIKVDAVQTRLLIGGSSVPHEHRNTPLDGNVAICMYGDDTMEHEGDMIKYKKILENAGNNLVNTDTITQRVSVYDPSTVNVNYKNGKIDLTGQLVIGKNLLSDKPTWCPIATLDDIPTIIINTTVKDNYFHYDYHYKYYYDEPTYTYSYVSTQPPTSSIVGPIESKYDTYLPPVIIWSAQSFNSWIDASSVTYSYYTKGDWPPGAQPADWETEWVETVVWQTEWAESVIR